MHNLWEKMNMFAVSQKRLIDQKNQIIKNQWFSELEQLNFFCEDKSSVLIEEIGCKKNGADKFCNEVLNKKNSFEMEATRLTETNKNNRTILPALRNIYKTKQYVAVKKIYNIFGKIRSLEWRDQSWKRPPKTYVGGVLLQPYASKDA